MRESYLLVEVVVNQNGFVIWRIVDGAGTGIDTESCSCLIVIPSVRLVHMAKHMKFGSYLLDILSENGTPKIGRDSLLHRGVGLFVEYELSLVVNIQESKGGRVGEQDIGV